MDELTVAIVSALATLGVTSVDELAKQATKDAYESLKRLLQRKSTHAPTVSTALELLEQESSSSPRAQVLDEEIKKLHISSDPELLAALSLLTSELEKLPAHSTFSNYASGSNIAQASGSSTAVVIANDRQSKA